MDKIKDLLKQLGASEELSKAIISEMLQYKEREKAALMENFKDRLEKAKKICLEEFETEKVKLARKIEVFLEARVNQIDREAQRQAAIGESESAKMLRDVKCLLEGIPVDGTVKEIQAAKEENQRLRVRLNQALQECTSLKEEAGKANTIAMKALERNRILEGEHSGKRPVSESRQPKAPARLESLRTRSAQPKTTRKVLTESQVPAQKTGTPQSGDPNVMKIASQVDETPAYLSRG
jgi:hypothetical protein